MTFTRHIAMMVLFLGCATVSGAQLPADSAIGKLTSWISGLRNRSIHALEKGYDRMEARVTRQTERYLKKLEKEENKLNRKLQHTDSAKAAILAQSSHGFYGQLQQKLGQPDSKITQLGSYIPALDSMQTVSKYLSQAGTKLGNLSPERLGALGGLNSSLGKLQGQMQNVANIKAMLRQRKEQLKQQLENVLGSPLQNFNKQVYYYQAQMEQYKQMLSDPDKMAEKLLSVLRNTPAFKVFMSKSSILAQLFPMPNSYGDPSLALSGLQTRTSVQEQLARQLSSAGSGNPQQYLQQQIQQAQGELNQLKDKINKAGGQNSSDLEMPDFKPNNQKTKTFWKRIEYGLNIQSQKTNSLLPVTSDLALTAGYKLSDKATVGVGAGYKMGWGKNINNIRITGEGASLRSYLDVKYKGSIWITGGYELNYQQSFSKIEQLKNLDAWQRSGLVGLTKKYRIGKKKGNLQLLWDFLSYSQLPQTQPLKFRIGYTL
jgi:cell division protein ZapA (FtsZ GTPase activity inhibitor)